MPALDARAVPEFTTRIGKEFNYDQIELAMASRMPRLR
jgi:hypothetical protein